MKTFREQFDKLVKAYLANQVRPKDPCACFVGNLLNGSTAWTRARAITHDGEFRKKSVCQKTKYDVQRSIRLNSDNTYTTNEIYTLEILFMKTWAAGGKNEDSLFEAFEKTLLKLREIHESKGEVIQDYDFQKRESVLV